MERSTSREIGFMDNPSRSTRGTETVVGQGQMTTEALPCRDCAMGHLDMRLGLFA